MRRAMAAVLLVGVALVAACTPPPTGGGGTPTPTTYTNGRCVGTEGVTVIVDFTYFGNGIVIRCALGSHANGAAVLERAGFTHDFGRNPGTVCQLNGLPAEGHPACWTGVGFWSYWKATSTGAPWAYSDWGFMAGPAPQSGEVQGWRFAPFAAGTAQPPGVGTGG